MRIGFVGAGRMGLSVIDRLVAAQLRPVVLARRPGARDAITERGLTCAASVQETVRDADLAFCMVLTDEQVRDALMGEDGAIAGMPPGSVLVQHTTCDPATMVALAEAGASRGVAVLDAAVSGTRRDIAAGNLTLWIGGDPNALERVRPILETYADTVTHVGPAGSGQLVKVVNQALFVSQVGLAVDAVRFAERLGLDEATILEAIQGGSGSSRALSSLAWIGVDHVGERLAELMAKDVDVVRSVAARYVAPLGALGQVLDSETVQQRVLCGGVPPDRATLDHTGLTPGSIRGAR